MAYVPVPANFDPSLVSGGDSHAHWHSEDRVPTQVFLQGLQGVAQRRAFTGDYMLTGREDFASFDTSSTTLTVTLPLARQGLEVEILKVDGVNPLIIVPQMSDTILGTTGATLSTNGAAIRFKAFDTDWRPI